MPGSMHLEPGIAAIFPRGVIQFLFCEIGLKKGCRGAFQGGDGKKFL
jgi:hypothetical protein